MTAYIPESATCRDCGGENPMLVEWTERGGRRIHQCKDCYEEQGKEAPVGLFGAKIVDQDPETTKATA